MERSTGKRVVGVFVMCVMVLAITLVTVVLLVSAGGAEMQALNVSSANASTTQPADTVEAPVVIPEA